MELCGTSAAAGRSVDQAVSGADLETMRTLFAAEILSPSPVPAPRPDHANPFELVFRSGLAVASSSDDSRRSSVDPGDWLTHHLQTQLSADTQTSFTHGRPSSPGKHSGDLKLALMGMKRCGKTSVQKVVFEKLTPPETLYFESDNRITTSKMPGFVKVEAADVPSHLQVLSSEFDHDALFGTLGAVIWIIDSQDEYFGSIRSLIELAVFLADNYPHVGLEVFIHKTDGLSEEYKYEAFREIRQRVQDELSDFGYGHRSVSYYQTSIFDHSVFEAVSKIVQKMLPQMPALEALLHKLCSICRIQKAYLFDASSKIYIATDASPTFLRDYEVCSDYLDVVVDIKQHYGWHRPPDPSVSTNSESHVTYDKTGDMYIYAREINEHLTLICIMGRGSSADKKALLDYNVSFVHDAFARIFSV